MKTAPFLFLLATSATSLTGQPAFAADPPAVVSPFDKDDPEIAQLKALKWQTVDFDKLDLRTRVVSLQALNQGLIKLGTKADGRLELLVDYIDQQGLGPAFAKEKDAIPEPPNVTYENMKKLAGAYMATPAGSSKFANSLPDATEDLLLRYLALYDKSAQRSFAEAAQSRHDVRAMGLFLQKQGKLEDFKKWAVEERKRLQAEHEKDLAEARTAAEAAEAERRQKAIAAAEQRRIQEEERSAAQMQQAMQYQQATGGTTTVYADDDDWWGDTWYPGTGAYYYGNAYRGYVREKVDSARDNWQGRPRPTPMPSRPRAGGGRRR